MDLTTATAIIAVLSAISGITLGWIGRAKSIKVELKEETHKDAVMSIDIEYIKRGVDDVRVEQKVQGQRFDALSERVTRVEESTKQAHHRINRLEGE